MGFSMPRSMRVVGPNITRGVWPDGPDTAASRSRTATHVPRTRPMGRLRAGSGRAERFERRDFTGGETLVRVVATRAISKVWEGAAPCWTSIRDPRHPCRVFNARGPAAAKRDTLRPWPAECAWRNELVLERKRSAKTVHACRRAGRHADVRNMREVSHFPSKTRHDSLRSRLTPRLLSEFLNKVPRLRFLRGDVPGSE